jgi:hypothetical protein
MSITARIGHRALAQAEQEPRPPSDEADERDYGAGDHERLEVAAPFLRPAKRR